ncbi:TIGR01777 family oxidoreductase [uncultured Eudoraea sp.]|uniref:TIGR01777 family oxidoreductase n=1 Tax=uncultured Eudoraea sp. TaxID=1035614 RepID=UPI00261677FE|nr:TIGR01777 family oxidoreductase [uncultured Eudoraea sp.]
MKVLIAGATGLIGKAITDLCREKGISVNYLTTDRSKIKNENNYQGFYWEPEKNKLDANCFEGVTAIINLAGAGIAGKWTKSYKKQILSSRIDSLSTLYSAIKNLNTKERITFISASAIGIYPNSLTDFYTEKETTVDASFLGEVSEMWEKEMDKFKELNCTVAKIRIGLVLSSEGGALPNIENAVRKYLGASFGSGEQWQSWIHVNDIARMFVFTMENNLSGVYNGVAPNPVTNRKMVKELAKVLNKPLFLPNIPQFAMRLILGEMSYLLFVSQRVSSKKIEKEGFNFEFNNICRALENIYSEQVNEDNKDDVLSKEYV